MSRMSEFYMDIMEDLETSELTVNQIAEKYNVPLDFVVSILSQMISDIRDEGDIYGS